MSSKVYQELKSVLKSKFGGLAIGVSNEGVSAPPISMPHQALDLFTTVIENYPASSEFLSDGTYDLGFKDSTSKKLSPKEMTSLCHGLMKDYPVVLLEDPLGQDDWDSWSEFQKTCKIELVGDDLLAANVVRIQTAEDKKAYNSLLLKINQIGTITEAIKAAKLAYKFGWSVFVSHWWGQTSGNFIADLTVAKYNRLMDIEDEIEKSSGKCEYAGENFRRTHFI
ncbi:enolase C-terminal domain-like protein [Halenospora varia]|nr:enolase C-terminal domain-like protein [Halenospora varia]